MSESDMRVVRRRAHERPPPQEGDDRFTEVVLYLGNQCNRACFFCCVDGSPEGYFAGFDSSDLTDVLRLIRPNARIKLYGGEPTLWVDEVVPMIRGLRSGGYRGRLTVFSNGIQAERLLRILAADPPTEDHPGTDCYLNAQIWWGAGVEAIPPGRKRMLREFALREPGRLWLSHHDVLPVGAAREHPTEVEELGAPQFDGTCARCFPTLKGDGTIHACAFAVEEASERYRLGALGDGPETVRLARERFFEWIDTVIEPAARLEGRSVCEICVDRARTEDGSAPALTGSSAPSGYALPTV